ncbi:MAG: class I SAM-dependent methyltransferase [Lachnospiraceae bacterium]|nr:class I SAM-dependent methyltransferase [Lachnospiraceae bacterium]
MNQLEIQLQQAGLTLEERPEGLTLIGEDGLTLYGDYTRMLPRLRQNNLTHEMLIKAAKIKNPDHALLAIDATAGLGEDSLLLAAAGFEVELYEYNPVIAALLKDTLERAAMVDALKEPVRRMHLNVGDSLSAMQQMADRGVHPDVILLDPMFPERQKSGLIKKKLQLIQRLEMPCIEEEALLLAACALKPHKVIIKRPAKGPYLAGKKPSYSIDGKAVRYDCIVTVS